MTQDIKQRIAYKIYVSERERDGYDDMWSILSDRAKESYIKVAETILLDFAEREALLQEEIKLYKAPEFARNQPCGCVTCHCEDLIKCHGCGAKNCGTHEAGEIPNPIYKNNPQLDKIKDLAAQNEKLKKEVLATINRFQDMVGFQDGESRNQLIVEIYNAVEATLSELGINPTNGDV